MDNQIINLTSDEIFFISAVQNEIFNRVFSTIRHDLVGDVSASLMRISMVDRILKKEELDLEKVQAELLKIDHQLRNNIVNIRDLAFWDFDSASDDFANNVLTKSIQLISSQLAMKNIQVNRIPFEYEELEKVETKPLLYSLICLLSFFEDNNYENLILNIFQSTSSITITIDQKINQNPTVIFKKRNLKITEEIAIRFAKLQNIDIIFDEHQVEMHY